MARRRLTKREVDIRNTVYEVVNEHISKHWATRGGIFDQIIKQVKIASDQLVDGSGEGEWAEECMDHVNMYLTDLIEKRRAIHGHYGAK